MIDRSMPHEKKFFILPILGLLAKAAPIVGGIASGLAAYESIREGPGGLARVPAGSRSTALATVPRTRSEIERGQALSSLYSRNGGAIDATYTRRRRMNVLNPRALRRSIARVKGFSKFAKRVGSYTNPGQGYKLKGFGRKKARR